jgi:hypothetical protein
MYRFINWFFRHTERTNRNMAKCARALARMITRMSHLLRGNARQHVIGLGNVLENFAQTVEQPQQGRSANSNTLFFALFYGGIVGFWFASILSLSGLIGPFSWLIGIILLLAFAVLMLFLLVSGDIYFDKRDEAQKAMAHEAATWAMAAVIILLLGFACIDKSGPVWQHSNIYQTLALTLIVITRIVYMARLASLRWRELVIVDSELDALQ